MSRTFKTTAAKRAYAQKLRDDRRARRRCRDCDAGLQDGDKSRCVECKERNSLAQQKWRKNGGTATETKRRRRIKAERRQLKLCARCGDQSGDKYECESCAFKRKLQTAGVAQIDRKPALRAPSDARELREYRPLDEIANTYRVRVLRALWWLTNQPGEWAETREIFQAAGVEDDYWSRDRNTAQVMLGRLVRYGLVERRVTDKPQNADYRITDAGRAEVALYRKGEMMRVRVRRAA